MIVRSGLAALVALASACFNPRYAHVACGRDGACPADQSCNLATEFCEADSSIADAGAGTDGSVGDGHLCFGTGVVKVCLSSAPDRAVSYPTVTLLDTTGSAGCTRTVTQSGGPELCVIAGTTVTIGSTVTVIGSRPLVLIASDSMTISGTLDLSSTRAGRLGAGAGLGSCATAGRGADDTGGGGGGGGGGLGTKGGTGGTGDANDNGAPSGQAAGGTASAAQATPSVLRGGCRGGDGGSADMLHRGPGGGGGGAVYLIAGNAIHITGDVFGAVIELSELAVLLTVIAWMHAHLAA